MPRCSETHRFGVADDTVLPHRLDHPLQIRVQPDELVAESLAQRLHGRHELLHRHAVLHRGELAEGAEDEDAALVHYRRVRDEIGEFCQTIPEKLQESGA